jgi:anti-anti-sigma factor
VQVNGKVLPIIEKEETNIVLDLSNVDFLSSVGMMDLAKYLVLLTDKKRLLKLVKPSKPVYDTMVKMGFDKRFDIYDSVEAAISSF